MSAQTDTFDRKAFFDALANYRGKRAESDAIDTDEDGCDEAIDAYCVAMDAVFNTPAPDAATLDLKLDLLIERYEDFSIPVEAMDVVRADIRRLTGLAA